MGDFYCDKCKKYKKLSLIYDNNTLLQYECDNNKNEILLNKENIIQDNIKIQNIKDNRIKYNKYCFFCDEPILNNNEFHSIHNIYDINDNKLTKFEIDNLNNGIKNAINLINNNMLKCEEIINLITLKLNESFNKFRNIFNNEINLLKSLKNIYLIHEKSNSLDINIINNLRNLIKFDFREFKSFYDDDIFSYITQFNSYLLNYSKKGFILSQKKKIETIKKYKFNNSIQINGIVSDFISDINYIYLIIDEKIINVYSKNFDFILKKEFNDIYLCNLIKENNFIISSYDKLLFCSFNNNDIIINQQYNLIDFPIKIIITKEKKIIILCYFYILIFQKTNFNLYQEMICIINSSNDLIELNNNDFAIFIENEIVIYDNIQFNIKNKLYIKELIIAIFVKNLNDILIIQDKNEVFSYDLKQNKICNSIFFSSNIENIQVFNNLYLIIYSKNNHLSIYNINNFNYGLKLKLNNLKIPFFFYEKNFNTWNIITGNEIKEITFEIINKDTNQIKQNKNKINK
jgi:hypothetical protein